MRTSTAPAENLAASERLKFVDLFAGLGGFHLALSRLGHECVFASEIDPVLRELYAMNFGIAPAGDIREIAAETIPSHDVLCAGFPCQPFSKAGEQEGFDCPKWGDLFDQVLRVINHHKPAYLILENVPNLLRHDSGRTWRDLLSRLRDEGYDVASSRLSPHDYGIPQNRERLFIVASLAVLPAETWPRKSNAVLSIQTILEHEPQDARRLSDVAVACLETWQEFLDRFPKTEDLPWFPIWSGEFGATYPFEGTTPFAFGPGKLGSFRGTHGASLKKYAPRTVLEALPSYARAREKRFPSWKEKFIRLNRELYWRNKDWIDEWLPKIKRFSPSQQKLEWNCKGEERNIWNCLIQFRASGVRVKRPSAAPTLVAMTTTQVPVVAWERRFMTARECARLQSLDDLRHLPEAAEHVVRALGNAVNSELVEKIASQLLQDARPRGVVPKAKKLGVVRAMAAEKARVAENTINIRPGVSVLSVLRHLNYQPWYALAEFVDNALQSYLARRKELQKVDGKNAKLKVSITIDPDDGGRIVVRDNAAGIHEADYARAFRAAEIPVDRSGLSEFGMGMKSASCWFAPRWSVRTKALGEPVEKTVTFDIASIVRDSLEELDVRRKKAEADAHYTEIILSNVYRTPQKRTLGKIREHLASIYRLFTADGTLELLLNNEPLTYESPAVLTAPYYKTPKGKPRVWRKDIDISLGGGKRVTGFAAIRETGSTSDAGFALFRRGRLIQGSADEGYRPEFIFGRSNSFVYQRVFGELHLEGFQVSHTKDGFRWDESEQDFLELLRKELDKDPIPLLQQAREFRMKPSREELKSAAESAVQRTAATMERELPAVLPALSEQDDPTPPAKLPKAQGLSQRVFSIERNGTPWEITIETTDDPAVGDWVETSLLDPVKGVRRLGVRMALAHPFTERFAGPSAEEIEPLLRIAAAIGLAETTARESGVKKAGTVRIHFNELLRDALSKP